MNIAGKPIVTHRTVPLLIISGSMGTGKTTVLSEASDLLSEAGIAHAAIDLDWLAVMHPQRDTYGRCLAIANLAAVWPVYAAKGAERLIVARVVENRAELDQYRAAVPGAQPIVCRLTAPLALAQERLRVREPGMFLEQALERAEELAGILERAGAEDFTVDNGPSRLVSEVARDMLSRAGWL